MCVTRINLITYLLQQLCEAHTLVIPVSLGRDTDTTETVTSHDWQKKTWTQALGLRSPYSYTSCCAVYRSWGLLPAFPKPTVAPYCLKPKASSLVDPPHSAAPVLLTSSHLATLVVPLRLGVFFSYFIGSPWNKMLRPKPDWAPLSICSGPQFSHLYNRLMARENVGLSKSIPSHSTILITALFLPSLFLSFRPLANSHTSFKANLKGFLLQEPCLDFSSS